MQAAIWYGPQDLRIEEIEKPKAGAGEIVVKVGAATTCGSDFKAYRYGHPVLAPHPKSPFGHEMAGHIVEVGKGVAAFRVGDRIVAANSAPCGDCFFCRHSQENICEHPLFLNGAFAEFIKIPAPILKYKCLKLDKKMTYAVAAIAEPLSCVVNALTVTAPKRGDVIAIIGAGSAGLMLQQVLTARGCEVTMVTRDAKTLEVARKLNGGRGPDVVIEAVGTPATWELALSLVRKGGKVCCYGGCPKGTEIKLDTYKLHYEQVSLFGVFHHTPASFREAVSLLEAGTIDATKLLAGERPLAELPALLKAGLSKKPLKVAIIP